MKPREPGREPAMAADQSLIPLIQETERQVKQAQEQARDRLEAEVAAAEKEAELALQQAKEQIPLRMERRHREELARIQAAILQGSSEQEAVLREALQAAERNFGRAVEAIVKAVWEGG
jgi:outer membrane PBP1 activator LpoA protein